MKRYFLFLSMFSVLFVLFSCASGPQIGKMKVVEESGSKPGWVKTDKDFFEKKGDFYFRGVVTDRKDLGYAKREAKAEAIKNIAEKVNTRVRTEFKEATQGSNVSDEGLSLFTSDAIAWVADNLNIQGIAPSNVYWQRVEKVTPEGVKYSYNVYVLCQIPKADYEKARNMAIKALLKKYANAGQQDAKKAATTVQKRLMGNR